MYSSDLRFALVLCSETLSREFAGANAFSPNSGQCNTKTPFCQVVFLSDFWIQVGRRRLVFVNVRNRIILQQKNACKLREVKKEHRERTRSAVEKYVKKLENVLLTLWCLCGWYLVLCNFLVVMFFYGATALTITAGNSQSPKYWPDKHQTIDKTTHSFIFSSIYKNCKPP